MTDYFPDVIAGFLAVILLILNALDSFNVRAYGKQE